MYGILSLYDSKKGRVANQRKVQNGCHLENYESESLNILCLYIYNHFSQSG